MDQYKRSIGLRSDSGSSNKRDTPVKPALGRRHKHRRLLLCKRYEAFPEEPEEEVMNDSTVKPKSPVSVSTVHSKSPFSLRKATFTETPRHKATLPATRANKNSSHRVLQAGHPVVQVAPILKAHEGGEITSKEEEQSMAVTLGSITLSSTSFSSDETEDENSLVSTTPSSLPSPEIFRTENHVETFNFPIEEDLLDLHIHIKNSTLLDVSHAESIHVHHPPNLSTILDASTILAENTCEISNNKEPGPDVKPQTVSFKSDKAFRRKTPPKPSNRRPILHKKKVSFKSPVIAEIFNGKHTPASKLTTHNPSEPFQMSHLPEEGKRDVEASPLGESSSKEETLPLTVNLKRPVKTGLEKAKFFDFATDKERDTFFQVMRERCVKLNSVTFFPFTAA
ncbi:uncharacterized protein LOC115792528 [Archocentrus centrarchus]|uniref:uncharacterized protein LOC115792528 n=1 Tax=Archocentrus centrarchus TaxID=63155 RepID=UPI0011EA108E|nr:uncharacterized protein LOC115792528 [Archocentrus centrarchus]